MPIFMPSTEEHTTLSTSRVQETRIGNKTAQLAPSSGPFGQVFCPNSSSMKHLALPSNPFTVVSKLEKMEGTLFTLLLYCWSVDLSIFSLNQLKSSVCTSLSRVSLCLF